MSDAEMAADGGGDETSVGAVAMLVGTVQQYLVGFILSYLLFWVVSAVSSAVSSSVLPSSSKPIRRGCTLNLFRNVDHGHCVLGTCCGIRTWLSNNMLMSSSPPLFYATVHP